MQEEVIKFYSDRIWWLLCCFWELECYWNEGGWRNCLFISYTSLHECDQVYMTVNSCDLLCNVAYKSRWDAGWQRRGVPAGWGIFQNKRNPYLYLAHQYCGYFCARFPSAWRCIAWFILFKMWNLCTVCLDAPKDIFFDPCCHRCTCYSCGMRYLPLMQWQQMIPLAGVLVVCWWGFKQVGHG
jgi:hypothetical protein